MTAQAGRLPPPFTPGREAAEVRGELTAAFERVIASGHYLLGPELEALEAELASRMGRRHVVGVGSGTDALVLALRALDIGPGDEVIVPALTAVPTAAAVAIAGARPVLADVDPKTACLTAESVNAVITESTAAVIAVHLYGFPVDLTQLKALTESHSLALLEDIAQAFGATDTDGSMVGGDGIAGCASFYPTKILASLGDAGAVVTDDPSIADRIRLLRSHGHEGEYRHSVIAGNSRLDELQAAFIRVKIGHIDEWIDRRRAIARRLRSALESIESSDLTMQSDHVGHSYQVLATRHPDRDGLRERLAAAGAPFIVHYPLTISEQDAFERFDFDPREAPEALAWAGEELSLPTAPQVTDDEVDALIDLLTQILQARR